jgi:hypothetical protein
MRRGVLLAFAASLIVVGCAKDAVPAVGLYDHAPVPAVPDHSAPLADLPNDGQYWATKATVKDGQLVFTLGQAFFGTAEDYRTVDDGRASETVLPSRIVSASVVDASRQNYAITGVELANLVGGGKPAVAAPAGFVYQPDPFLLTVSSGAVTVVEQIWIP